MLPFAIRDCERTAPRSAPSDVELSTRNRDSASRSHLSRLITVSTAEARRRRQASPNPSISPLNAHKSQPCKLTHLSQYPANHRGLSDNGSITESGTSSYPGFIGEVCQCPK